MGSAIQEVGYIMASKAKSAAVVSCLTGVLLVFAGCGGTRDPVGERVYELTLHHHDPATASQGMFFDELAAEAIRRSNGRLKISVFTALSSAVPETPWIWFSTEHAISVEDFPRPFPESSR